MTNFPNKLLNYLHLSEADYQKLIAPVTFATLPPYHQFKQMDIAVDRVLFAISKKEKITKNILMILIISIM